MLGGEVHLEMIGLHYIQLNLIPQSAPGRCHTPAHATSRSTIAGMIFAGLEERQAELLSLLLNSRLEHSLL
jgi:hypothetical protein